MSGCGCCKPSKTNCCVKTTYCCEPTMNDCLAKEIECIWKKCFCDAKLLPCIGYPSNANCVMTLTHSLGQCYPKLQINGLKTNSIIANNAFYSAEVSCGKWLNIYKINLPDVPGKCGCKSSGELYIELLSKMCISISSVSPALNGTCPAIISISSIGIGMEPKDFTNKQISAVKCVLEYINENNCNTCC